MTRSNNNRRTVYLTAIGLLVLSLGAVFVVRSFGAANGADGSVSSEACEQPTQVQLSTTPELKPQLDNAAKALAGKRDDGTPCLQFTISGAPSSKVAKDLAAGGDNRPDLWIPDSSLWVNQADDGQSVPTVAVPSIASSPMVLVSRNSNFADTSSWLRSFTMGSPALLNPLAMSPGALALLAVQAERQKTSASDTQIAQVMVPLAQRLGSLPTPYTDVTGLYSRAGQENSTVIVAASEQSFVRYQEEHPDTQLKAKVPDTGTLALDYPVVVTAKTESDTMSEAAKALAAELLSDSAAKSRDEAGFRDALLSPLSGGRGVGDITMLTKSTAQAVEKTLLEWTRLSLSAHTLAVLDVSGSMAEKIGGKTRMQLTKAAAGAGLQLFPEHASLGLWTFSTKIGPDGADYRQLVPIKKLTKSHRNQILANLNAQNPIPNGGTGLYETAIAAVRAVRTQYDSTAVNTVLLFTDGKNDDPGSPTLAETLKILDTLRDPARPVRIIALGIGTGVDAGELSQLAKATGGQSYLARDPSDLQQVFIDALQNR